MILPVDIHRANLRLFSLTEEERGPGWAGGFQVAGEDVNVF